MSQNTKNQTQAQNAEIERSKNLKDSPTMSRLMTDLQKGTDVGHYGRLTFAMVARHFLKDDEIIKLLSKQPDQNEEEARAMLSQVKAHNYNPPKRERLLEWESQQDYNIIPDPQDPNSGNLYRELQFPDDVYEHIEDYYEHGSAAHQ